MTNHNLRRTIAETNIQWTLFWLAMAFFIVAPTVVAQDKSFKQAPASWSEKEISEFNRLSAQGLKFFQNRDYAKARINLEKACKIWPESADAQCNLGIACMNMRDYEAAIIHFRQALAIEPNKIEAAFNLGGCYISICNLKEGRIWLQKCIDSKTADPTIIADAKAELKTFDTLNVAATVESPNTTSVDYFDSLAKTKFAWRWPINNMPLKIFFEPGVAVQYYHPEFRTILVNAFNEWAAATDGKLSWIEIFQKDKADIVCEWQREPGASLYEGGKVDAHCYNSANGTLAMKHAILTIFTLQQNPVGHGLLPLDNATARSICLHEVGHALGLGGHSPNPNDIMSPVTGGSTPLMDLSVRDKNTIARLYSR